MGLPPILSSTLGYKFNRHTLKFTKAGLIVLKTQPAGATVYLDKKLLNLKTPATINELLPGKYHIRFELDKHYPWSREVEVEAGKVTRLEKIILFPLRSAIKQLNTERLSFFLADEEKETLYYINQTEGAIYKSDLEGEHFERVAGFIKITPQDLKWKISSDRHKLLYFNNSQIGIVNLISPKDSVTVQPGFIFNYTEAKIIDIFWQSDSYHLLLASNKSIEILKTEYHSWPLVLVTLTKKDNAQTS
ncbi:MAG: PEGA domain-containing protein [bacterium]